MSINHLAAMPIIDSHVHFIHPECKDEILALFASSGYRAANLVCLPNLDGGTQNNFALDFKTENPEQIYMSGAIDYRLLLEKSEQFPKDLPRQVHTLIDQGFDGMKMIEGKPNVRKLVGLSLDDPVYDGLWQTLEQEQFPLILHIADPEFFWDAQSCPDWAKENDWDYSDGTFPSKNELHQEVDHILERFPNLKLTLAHFSFLSTDLIAAGQFLKAHPTVSFDLAPHIDMYTDFSENAVAARKFFIEHSDRILYGTDMDTRVLKRGADGHRLAVSVVSLIRQFLESEKPFQHFGKKSYEGLNLPEESLRKIYYQNFERIYSKRPAIPGGP